MLIVIDESGCTGFKSASSTHFVIGMVIFDSFHNAEEAANIINKKKRDIGFRREFRFSSSDNRNEVFSLNQSKKLNSKSDFS